jgi:hypothetical protein
VALRGKNPGPLFLQLGKGGRVLAGRRLSGDGVHKILETVVAKWPCANKSRSARPHVLALAAIVLLLSVPCSTRAAGPEGQLTQPLAAHECP